MTRSNPFQGKTAEQGLAELARTHQYLAETRYPAWHPELNITEKNRKAVLKFCAAITQDLDALRAFGMRPGRGVLLSGPTSVGKTHLLELVKYYLSFTDKDQPLVITKAQEVQYAYAKKDKDQGGNQAFKRIAYKKHHNGLIVNQSFDDILSERPTSQWGEPPVFAFAELIPMREELFTTQGVLSHFTTNYRSQEISERYGERVLERLKWMCEIILFPEDATNWRAYNPYNLTLN